MVEFRYQDYGTRVGVYVNEEFIGAMTTDDLGSQGVDYMVHLMTGVLAELGIGYRELDA